MLLLIALCLVLGVIGDHSMKICDISRLNSCPVNSACSQSKSFDTEGLCVCDDWYIFNALYQSDSDYCLRQKSTTVAPGDRIRDGNGAQSEGMIEIQKPSPPHHHIIGGILIPVFLVFSCLGVAFVVIRYRVVHRLRNRFFGTRHRRPTYMDVAMMGSDFDPPLI